MNGNLGHKINKEDNAVFFPEKEITLLGTSDCILEHSGNNR